MAYSQSTEEDVILEFYKNKPTGRLLDVGAFTGKELSNSLALFERGWSGLVVEPNPFSLVHLIRLHGLNSKVKIVNALVSDGPDFGVFHVCEDAVSTTSAEMKKLWDTVGFAELHMPFVQTSKLAELVLGGGLVDFVSVDVEDNTMSIVKGLKAVIVPASLVCLEHTVGPWSVRDEMTNLLADWGFEKIHTTNENFIFANLKNLAV